MKPCLRGPDSEVVVPPMASKVIEILYQAQDLSMSTSVSVSQSKEKHRKARLVLFHRHT